VWFSRYHETMTLRENFQIWNIMHEICDKSMRRPSVIQLNPSSSVSGSGSGDNVVDEDDSKSDKPQRSRRSSKASKEDKEFENETKKYLYMAATAAWIILCKKMFFWLNVLLRKKDENKFCWEHMYTLYCIVLYSELVCKN